MAAAGASYGGYMVNWMATHTRHFRAYVSHAGIFDLRSMGLETEELWFPTWEFGGLATDARENYDKWSPSMSASSLQAPMLVTHGELDYRVPVGQAMQLFTALQTRQVPSKLMLFPDEGHWILKPQNSVAWYQNVSTWLTEWTRPAQ
jgi:dipeptidyl aminopeptidase/acylaminoacyl peptidase